jgi:hypothetical protein
MAQQRAHRPVDASSGLFVAHPVAVLAILVLLANDHVLKALVSGVLTGKLSDVAGLLFFPLLLADGVLAGSALAGVGDRASRSRVVRVTALVTAGAFALVKTTAFGAGLLGLGLAVTGWPVSALVSGPHSLVAAPVVVDPTDLVAIPVVLVAVWIARDRGPSSPVQARPRRDRLVSAGVALLALVSCVATSQSAPPKGPSTAIDSQPMTLGAATPASAWHVTWTTTGVTGATLAIYASLSGGDAHAADDWPAGVAVSLVPDDASLAGTAGWGDTMRFGSIALPACPKTCASGAIATVRLTGPAPDTGVTIHLVARIEGAGSVPDGMRVAISVAPRASPGG